MWNTASFSVQYFVDCMLYIFYIAYLATVFIHIFISQLFFLQIIKRVDFEFGAIELIPSSFMQRVKVCLFIRDVYGCSS